MPNVSIAYTPWNPKKENTEEGRDIEDSGQSDQETVMKRNPANPEDTAGAIRAILLIAEAYSLADSKIGLAVGLSESFVSNLRKKQTIRMEKKNIELVAELFGLTADQLCSLTKKNLSDFAATIEASEHFSGLKRAKHQNRKWKRKIK